MTATEDETDPRFGLNRVTLYLCDGCLRGEGGECHTPGCALWMNRAPDLPPTVEHVEYAGR